MHNILIHNRNKIQYQSNYHGIEGFWSYAKNWLYMYRGVPKKFMHLYLAETSFRFNHREQDLSPLLYKALKKNTISQIQ